MTVGLELRRWVSAALSGLVFTTASPAANFIRGDANQDGQLDISDPKLTLGFLFVGGRAPGCLAAADANDDEILDISDALATLGFLFLGSSRLPPPGPAPGPDPTPGIGCGFGPPEQLTCRPAGPSVALAWVVGETYDSIDVLRDGRVAATLSGNATRYTDHPPAGGAHDYGVRGAKGAQTSDAATCRVTGLPANQPPSLTILSPAQGSIFDAPSVTVQGRVNDDGEVVRIVAADIDVTPVGPPVVPYTFTATVPLVPGPNLLRVEAVDGFGRTAFREVAIGRRPILATGAFTPGMALDLSGTTGYDEVQAIVRPFLNQVPALLDNAVSGALLFNGSLLGVDIRVTGNHAEVSGAIGIDIFPSAEGGGRVGLSASFATVKLFADGRSDFGFLGTDNWTATWTGSNLTIHTTLSLAPRAGGASLQIASSGFIAEIGSSTTSVSGFLDPFGIFDGVVNFLADTFRGEIETQIKVAVTQAANQQILPILEKAFSGLKLNLDLGTMSLDTRFHDVLESAQGLSFLFDSVWTGGARDPSFPAYPGSSASFASYPTFPLSAAVSHPVDAAISLSADTLDQALFGLTSSGLLKATVDLAGVASPIPLTVGSLASLLDDRLLALPGVGPDNPVALRVETERPAELRLAAGAIGRPLIGFGSVWRFFEGTAEPPAAWRMRVFDDASWERGPSGFGYSNDDAELRSVRTELTDMQGSYSTLYTRVSFALANPAALSGLVFHAIHDDGFVAYLNGTEVARVNVAGNAGTLPPFNDVATSAVEPTEITLDLSARRNLLRAGDNVLAVQGLNAGAASSDFVLAVELLEPVAPPVGTLSQVPAIIDLKDVVVTFVADTKADGVGVSDTDHVADEVDLFALKLGLSLQAGLQLVRGAGGTPEISFRMLVDDGPDPDQFPDAVVGGAAGIEVGVAREAIDMSTSTLMDFAHLVLALFGPSLGDALAGFALPSFPVPELAFDLDGDGASDVRLGIANATMVPVDVNADRNADWICILMNLSPQE